MNFDVKFNEECIEFYNPDGLLLRGVIHNAAPETAKGLSLICLNTGLNDMVGWHRIQLKVARLLAGKGYNVLRYDDSGIGDSEGELKHSSIVHIFSEIETGLFVQNADAAVKFMWDRFSNNRLVYLGFCGGGLTAFHSAAKNKQVDGVICIGGPITLSSDDYLHKRDPWIVQQNVAKYKSKLFSLQSWINFLTFRGEYRVVFSSLFHYLRHKMQGEYEEKVDPADLENTASLNKTIFASFEYYTKRHKPCLFFYAETDSATWEFKKYFLPVYQQKYFQASNLYEFVEAEKANHILSSQESQQLLNKTVLYWLKTHFSF